MKNRHFGKKTEKLKIPMVRSGTIKKHNLVKNHKNVKNEKCQNAIFDENGCRDLVSFLAKKPKKSIFWVILSKMTKNEKMKICLISATIFLNCLDVVNMASF